MSGEAEHRLVHIDLKGAPPKVQYFEQIFPLFHNWGATGILLEYEDMFPYSKDLGILQARNAYSIENVNFILDTAKNNKLTVIPLLQTFGHLEFVLKHEKFRHLREVPRYPMTLCPVQEESFTLVTSMVDQVLRLHPESKWFHIGADEVFHIGCCEDCDSYMAMKALSKQQLFLEFVVKIATHVRLKYPGVQPIMWDDMLRQVDLIELRESRIGKLVEPMVWQYTPTITIAEEQWSKYSAVFPNLWVASAFKGATGPNVQAVNISYHVQNHISWIQTAAQIKSKFKTFRGYAVTGWQRYDHYAVLCELLPAGLPSMLVCLQTLIHGNLSNEQLVRISSALGFPGCLPLNPFSNSDMVPICSFPGWEVYIGVFYLIRLLVEYNFFIQSDSIDTWMSTYLVKLNFTNPIYLEQIEQQAKRLYEQYRNLKLQMEKSLSKIFFDDTVEEWIAVNLVPKLEKLEEIVLTAEKQSALSGSVRDDGLKVTGVRAHTRTKTA